MRDWARETPDCMSYFELRHEYGKERSFRGEYKVCILYKKRRTELGMKDDETNGRQRGIDIHIIEHPRRRRASLSKRGTWIIRHFY